MCAQISPVTYISNFVYNKKLIAILMSFLLSSRDIVRVFLCNVLHKESYVVL